MNQVRFESQVTEEHLSDLMDLFTAQWWSTGRTVDDVNQMLSESDIVVAAIDEISDRLVGFARVITDYTYVALILDVIVAADFQGSGLGARIMESLVSHPGLTGVRSLELVCQPDLVGFYARWSFTERVGQSQLMRRTTDERLTAPQ